jgi:hypothetical protein
MTNKIECGGIVGVGDDQPTPFLDGKRNVDDLTLGALSGDIVSSDAIENWAVIAMDARTTAWEASQIA